MTFDQLLSELESAESLAAKARLSREFADTQSSPIIEESRVTFFYISADAQEVALEGDWTNWQPTARLTYLPDTPLWYRIERFPRTARLEYRIVVNGRYRLDPRNSRTAPSGFGPHSEVVMPDYRAPREIADDLPSARGSVAPHWLMSHALNDRRTFWVCLPPHFDPQKKYPVAYFNDGDGYLHFADLPRITDYLIARDEVQPFISVLVKPNDREKEYARNNRYARFLVNELVPWVDQNYPTLDEPSARAIIGASFGGLISAHVALRYPEVFRLVGGQSGFYSHHKEALIHEYAEAENLGLRFHLVVGQFETDLQGENRPEFNFVAAQRRLAEVLRRKNYDVASGEFPEGHQWGFWRAHIGDALRFFWGK